MPLLLTMFLLLARADPLADLDALPSTAELPAEISAPALSPPAEPPGLGLGDRTGDIGNGGAAAVYRLSPPPPPVTRLRCAPMHTFGERSPCLSSLYGEPIILGAIDACALKDTIQQRLPHIRQCYAQALDAGPDVYGKLVVKFIIDRGGGVTEASVTSSTLGSPELEACVVGVISRTMFGPIDGGGIAIVSHPFVFSP